MRRPNEGGMKPETLVEERLRSWREEREESCEGSEERLRNVSGRESEMTLFCGEQVMPCHEHGVWLDGFHEESIDDEDDLGDGLVSKERRACPSGEREVTGTVALNQKKKKHNKNEREMVLVFSIKDLGKIATKNGGYGGGDGESLL